MGGINRIPGSNNCGWSNPNPLWQILMGTYFKKMWICGFSVFHAWESCQNNSPSSIISVLTKAWEKSCQTSSLCVVHVGDSPAGVAFSTTAVSDKVTKPQRNHWVKGTLCSYKAQTSSILFWTTCPTCCQHEVTLRLCCSSRGTREDLSYVMVNSRASCPGASAVPMLTSPVSTLRLETTLSGSTGSLRTTDETLMETKRVCDARISGVSERTDGQKNLLSDFLSH